MTVDFAFVPAVLLVLMALYFIDVTLERIATALEKIANKK